jgi:hypothetical protein
MRTDSRTTLLQQVYNSPLTWGEPHSVWGPPHVRGLLYTCCKSVVFLSFFLVHYIKNIEKDTYDFSNYYSIVDIPFQNYLLHQCPLKLQKKKFQCTHFVPKKTKLTLTIF